MPEQGLKGRTEHNKGLFVLPAYPSTHPTVAKMARTNGRAASPLAQDAKPYEENGIEANKEDIGGDEEESKVRMSSCTFFLSNLSSKLHENRRSRLQYILGRSQAYSRIMTEKMQKEKMARQAKEERAAKMSEQQKGTQANGENDKKATGRTTRAGDPNEKSEQPVRKRGQRQAKSKRNDDKYLVSDYIGEADVEKHESKGETHRDHSDRKTTGFQQPSLITGATLKDYQLYGVEWLAGLYLNGINGILADEMGLGKTLQTIAFFAHLKSKNQYGPFLVVCPASTLQNWMDEIQRFAPELRGLLYYSSDKKQRKRWLDQHRHEPKTPRDRLEFPIFVTSYEIAINDSRMLGSLKWKFIVVDEGHRLKNRNARLTRELKSYPSANRLILTGTPVHNNLAELWSLLNFILPDIFDNLEEFEKWFDFSDLHSEGGSARLLSREQTQHVISMLRDILDPFILQREKKHVEKDLPPKKEYMLYAPLTLQQKDLYEEVLNNSIRARLTEMKTGLSWEEIVQTGVHRVGDGWDPPLHTAGQYLKSNDSALSSTPTSGTSTPSKRPHGGSNGIERDEKPRKSRRGRQSKINYDEDNETEKRFMDRMEFHQGLREDDNDGQGLTLSAETIKRQSREHLVRQAQKEIALMKLQNPIMQLRKLCGHPFLLYWPQDPKTGEYISNEELIHASGKMMMLNRLLDALWARGHKVLLFSQVCGKSPPQVFRTDLFSSRQ